MPYSVKGFFEINEDMVQILLMLEVLFTQDSKVEDLFCGASSGSEPSLFFSNYFFSLGFQPIQDDFQVLNIKQFNFFNAVMPPKDVVRMANSVDPDQTAPYEQSDQNLHCLLRHICPSI